MASVFEVDAVDEIPESQWGCQWERKGEGVIYIKVDLNGSVRVVSAT